MFYFKNFPTIQYSNTVVKNIFSKVKLTPVVQKSLAVYYPYTLNDGERPDHTAEFYYKDASTSWLLYVTNNIVDPYYEWYLGDAEFARFVQAKYGSIANAHEEILYYQVNYYDDSALTTAGYEALPASHRKYWAPVLNDTYGIHEYRRKELDLKVETNKIINVIYTFAANDAIEVGDTISQYNGGTLVAQGTVNLNTLTNRGYELYIKNISGTFVNTYNCTFRNSNAEITLTKLYDIVQPIPDDEAVYWSPVTAYEYEETLNAMKKEIVVIDRSYLPRIEENMHSLFR